MAMTVAITVALDFEMNLRMCGLTWLPTNSHFVASFEDSHALHRAFVVC